LRIVSNRIVTNEWTTGRTNGLLENIMLLRQVQIVSLAELSLPRLVYIGADVVHIRRLL